MVPSDPNMFWTDRKFLRNPNLNEFNAVLNSESLHLHYSETSLERSLFVTHEWSFKDMWFLKRGLFFLVIKKMQHSKLVDSSRHCSQSQLVQHKSL
jgi:hypothetical protein